MGEGCGEGCVCREERGALGWWSLLYERENKGARLPTVSLYTAAGRASRPKLVPHPRGATQCITRCPLPLGRRGPTGAAA